MDGGGRIESATAIELQSGLMLGFAKLDLDWLNPSIGSE